MLVKDWMQKTVVEIKLFLQRSKFLLEEQKKRQLLLNGKND